MTPPTREPEVIAEARRTGTLSVGAILAEYDRVCAERDAAVRETRQERDRGDYWRDAYDDAKGRIKSCERDLNYIRRVTVGAVESDKLAATCKTIGEYRYVLLKAINAMDIAAVAAETQTKTEDTDR